MKKVLLTATVQSHICQFHKPLVNMLHESGYEVHVAARDNLFEKNGLSIAFVDKVYDLPFSRSPRSLDNVKAYRQLKQIIDSGDYEIIHCNTPMGGIVTRLAAQKARKRGSKVVYTAHGFHFFKGSSKKNWVLYYPIEWFMAHFCDTLITITREDYSLARQRFCCNIEHIHGVGVYSDRYFPVSAQKAMLMRKEEGFSEQDYLVLCVGELNDNKNQKTLIRAASKLVNSIPDLKVLFAGNGPNEEKLIRQIQELGLEKNVRMLGYRTDLEKITPGVDLVVSCSYREGMPLNIIEAELCMKPVIASINRGHKELIRKGRTGFLFNADDPDTLSEYIFKLYNNKKMGYQMGKCGYRIAQKYTSEAVTQELLNIYNNLFKD